MCVHARVRGGFGVCVCVCGGGVFEEMTRLLKILLWGLNVGAIENLDDGASHTVRK